MIQLDHHRSLLPIHCFVVFFLCLPLVSTQICQNDIPDFFYNVSFAGPIFDQGVYVITASNFSVASPINTPVFTFTVQPQTDFTRPSFLPTSVSGRALNNTGGLIDVSSSDSSFRVLNFTNGTYALVTNTYPLKYFSPYNRYLFNLIATQTFANRPPASSTATVQLNLENYNVNAPIFVPNNQTFSISETATPGTILGTVYATDADNDLITYSIDGTTFLIDATTGVLQLREYIPSSAYQYTITVTAKDDGSSCLPNRARCPQFITTTIITINVTAVNKNSPSFLGGICGSSVSFDEGNANGSNITTIVASDTDRGENGQITISFPSEQSQTTVSGLRNTAYTQFYLEQLPQGTSSTRIAYLKANITFDYDDPNSPRVWYLFILATDNGNPQRQSFCSLRINLLDVNDNSPVFIMTSWNYTIYQSDVGNEPGSSLRFLRILASDKDSGVNGEIEYFLVKTPIYFDIDRATGFVILQSGIPGVYAFNTSAFPITFQVYAVDKGAPRRTSQTNATVTIYFDNRSTAQPARWLDPRYQDLNFQIKEKFYERTPSLPISNITAGFNGTIFYSIVSQASSSSIMTVSSPFPNTYIPFSDVPVTRNGNIFSSGVIVTSGLHAEVKNFYLIYIRVLVNPPLIGSMAVTIEDENDQTPTFDIRSIVLSVVENEQGKRVIAQIQAFDRDIDPRYNNVRYSLNTDLSDTEAIGNFFVEQNGTIWTNGTFDRESNKTNYRIFIRASDNIATWDGKAANTQDFQFDVQVIDVNDVPPVFTNTTPISISIKETTANGTSILNLTITDTDFNTIIGFGILSGNTNNVFTFSLLSDNMADTTRTEYRATAQLKVVGPLSYESQRNYTLVLFAFDTQNRANITVIVNLLPENTKAPVFNFNPNQLAYEYHVDENAVGSPILGPTISATDPDIPSTPIVFEIVAANNQLNLNSINLDGTVNQTRLNIIAPGLSRDLPFGTPSYNFSIRATDENGNGVSSYASVTIKVADVNNNGPIPINSPWILPEGITNPSIGVFFVDYDDPAQNNTVPFQVQVINSPNFSISPTSSSTGNFTLQYTGVLNRTSTKNLTVTFNAIDAKGFAQVTTIPIIVGDQLNTYPLSNGLKTINVIYVDGYMNSLRNVPLGSVFVNDLDDWFRGSRTYTVRSVSNGQNFDVVDGQLRTSAALPVGTTNVVVDVTKLPGATGSSTAAGTIDLNVKSVDREFVRQAATIRIQGEYPETLIDPSLGNRLNTLRNALASILLVTADSIIILAIRPVFQYRSPYYPPLPFDQAKQQTLTDVVFYVPSLNRFDVENTINNNLASFATRFGIIANASGPNPCSNYVCPTNTICRATRTIQPLPYAIDSNQTSFVGINVVDSGDCVNATYSPNVTNTQSGCTTYSFNGLTNCPCSSVQSLAPVGPFCQVLGRTFNENGGGYATFSSSSFSNFAPTRFSFDFAIRPPVTDGLLLLFGRNTIPINDFFWTAIDIFQSRLRFQFRDVTLIADQTTLNASTWYHVEYQYVDATILVTINDCQYFVKMINNTSNSYDLSNVQLYLGGLPVTGSLVSGLYPTLTQINTFSGCIRNLQSNGYYLDMNAPLSAANSAAGACPCQITNSCTASTLARAADVIVPWYTWLIIALVLLLLATIVALGLLTCIRRRQQQKSLAGLYPDDTRDNIIDYKETAGEEDHAAYNLGVLKKPVYALSDEEILANGGRSGMQNLGYSDPIISRRPALGDYIDEKLTEQQTIAYANDTQLHYRYEGEGSIASDLSSIDSNQFPDEHDYRFLYSWGPKFSRLADLYAGGLDDPDDDDIMNNA